MPHAQRYIKPTLLSTSIDKTENPSHAQRFWYPANVAYSDDGVAILSADYVRWTLRNRGNYVRAPGDPEVRLGHFLGGILDWGANQEKYRARVKRR